MNTNMVGSCLCMCMCESVTLPCPVSPLSLRDVPDTMDGIVFLLTYKMTLLYIGLFGLVVVRVLVSVLFLVLLLSLMLFLFFHLVIDSHYFSLDEILFILQNISKNRAQWVVLEPKIGKTNSKLYCGFFNRTVE